MDFSNDPPPPNSNKNPAAEDAKSDNATADKTGAPAQQKSSAEIPSIDASTKPATNAATDPRHADDSSEPGAEGPSVEMPADNNSTLPAATKPVAEGQTADTSNVPGDNDSSFNPAAGDNGHLPRPTEPSIAPKVEDTTDVPPAGDLNNIPAPADQSTDADPGNPSDPSLPNNLGHRAAPKRPPPPKRTQSAPTSPNRSSRSFPFPRNPTPSRPLPLPHPSPPIPRPSPLQRFRNWSAFESEYITRTKNTIRGELRLLVRRGTPVSIAQQIAARDLLLSMLGRAEWAGIPASWVATHLGKVAHRRKDAAVPKVQRLADVQFWEDMWLEVRDRRAGVLAGETEEVKSEATSPSGAPAQSGESATVGEASPGDATTAGSANVNAAGPRTSEEDVVAAVADFEEGYTSKINAGAPGATGFPTAAEQIASAKATRRRWDRDGFLRRLFARKQPDNQG